MNVFHHFTDLQGKYWHSQQLLLLHCHNHHPSHRLLQSLHHCPLLLQTQTVIIKYWCTHRYTHCVTFPHLHFPSAPSSSHVWSSSWRLWSETLHTYCFPRAKPGRQRSEPSPSPAAWLCLSSSSPAVHCTLPALTVSDQRKEVWGLQ